MNLGFNSEPNENFNPFLKETGMKLKRKSTYLVVCSRANGTENEAA